VESVKSNGRSVVDPVHRADRLVGRKIYEMDAEMKAFVLILLIITSDESVVMQDFGSSTTCEAAGRMAIEKFGGFLSTVRYVCVEK
jgi:hypothetical protein